MVSGLTVGVVVAAGIATASIPDAQTGIFHGCVNSAGGLRVIDPSKGQTCLRSETAVHWAQQGPAGTSGHTVLSGTGAPGNAVGSDGDFYIDTAAHVFYGPKAGGAWPASGTSLIGSPGVNGTNGTNGTTGTNGTAVLNGTGAPSNAVGSDGDFYLDTAVDVLYGPKAGGAWPGSGTSLIGSPGAAGTNGANGLNGADGKTVRNGSGTPSNALGADGDFYLDTSAHKIFGPRAAGAWPTSGVSLIGPTGPPGSVGPTGPGTVEWESGAAQIPAGSFSVYDVVVPAGVTLSTMYAYVDQASPSGTWIVFFGKNDVFSFDNAFCLIGPSQHACSASGTSLSFSPGDRVSIDWDGRGGNTLLGSFQATDTSTRGSVGLAP